MKKRYLCPVCDRELTAKSYCPECRRIRREPIVYEGGLLPNESDHEGRQEAAAVAASKRNASGQNTSGRKQAPGNGRQVQSGGRVYDSRYADACGSSHVHTYGVPGQDPHKEKKAKKTGGGYCSRLARVFVFVVIMAILAAAFWEPLKEMTRGIVAMVQEEFGFGEAGDSLGEKPEAGWREEESFEDDDSDGYAALSEEEVVAAGEPCNGYSHYDMDGEEYLARLSEYGGELWPEEVFAVNLRESSNQVYKSGDDLYSYYRREAQIFLENGVYYSVACDTATGEVMEVTVGAETEEEFGPAFLLAACALEPERDRNEIWSGIKELLSMAGEEYYFGEWGIHEVYLSGGMSYYGSLSCLSQYDKYQN